jgi:hypothetical protein
MISSLPPRRIKCVSCGADLRKAVSFSALEPVAKNKSLQGSIDWQRYDLCESCFEAQEHASIFWKSADAVVKRVRPDLHNKRLIELICCFEEAASDIQIGSKRYNEEKPSLDSAVVYLLGEYLVRCKLLRCIRRQGMTEFKEVKTGRTYTLSTPQVEVLQEAKLRLEELLPGVK